MNFFDGAEIDQNLLEQTNPVFNTAKIAEINDVISEILEQTGFDQILTVV